MLIILHVEVALRDARVVLEETFRESVVLTLNPFILPPTHGYVQTAGSDTGRIPLLQLLVGGGAVDGGPLALTDINEFVEEDGVLAIQIDVFLYRGEEKAAC